MEIHCGNFEECFPIVSKAINGASFIAFDTEFTGLDDGCHINGLDTPEKRYLKLLKPAKDYLIIQFGLSIFTKALGVNQYTIESFNFSVFPKTTKFTPDVTLKFQGPSLEFVTYQGVDLDGIIKRGISYLSIEEEKKLRGKLLLRHSSESEEFPETHEPSLNVPHWKKEFVAKQIARVEAAVSDGAERVELEPCDLLSKLVIFDQLNSRFSNRVVLDADATGGPESIVVKVTIVEGADHKKAVLEKKRREELDELTTVLGFARIIKLLHKSNKMIVGHNMLLDVMHTISQFWGSLPSDYKSFKELVHQIFPRILDTKHMASMDPFKCMTNNRNLKELFDELKTNKKIASFILEIPEGFPDYLSQSSFHNAAYDAFVTGVCFLLMKSYLSTVQKNVVIEDKVKPYENKLYLMRIVDVPYINLSGEDLPLTTREHIFHLQFPKNKNNSDIKHLFAPFGDVEVKFIDDYSAFVSLLDKQKSALANRKLSSQKEKWYKLQPLAEWYGSRNEGSGGGGQNRHGNTVFREGPIERKKRKADDDSGCFGMEIMQENFEGTLAMVSSAIDEATFVAVDTVALGFDHGNLEFPFDTAERRYDRLLEPVRNHLVIQFGLCAFKQISGQNKFEVKPFNFNVYPKSSKLAPDVYFASKNSELELNASRGLSVGKIVDEGISYLSITQEKNLSVKLLSRSKEHPGGGSSPATLVPASKQDFVDKQIKSVESLMASRSADSVTLEPCNSFMRKLLYEQLKFKFSDRLFVETISPEGASPQVKVTFVEDPEHRRELEAKQQDKKLEDLHRALGFTRIMKMLNESNKLIVGHEMMHRVMQVVHQFWGSLPTDCKSFKALMGQIFPRLLDTKHVVNSKPFKGLIKSNKLHDVIEELRSLGKNFDIDVDFPPEYPHRVPRGDGVCNSALGAYRSGMCYLLVKSHLGSLQKNVPVDEKIASYENKLHMWNFGGSTFINVKDNDSASLSIEDAYHVQFKKGRDSTPILNILMSTGHLRMVDETSAVVTIHNKGKVEEVKKDLFNVSKSCWFKFEPLEDWLSTRESGQGTSVLRESPPNLKRKLAEDPKSNRKNLPAEKKTKQTSFESSSSNNRKGVLDPSKMHRPESVKSEGVQKWSLFEVPDDWD